MEPIQTVEVSESSSLVNSEMYGVASWAVGPVWPTVLPYIDMICEQGGYLYEPIDIFERVLDKGLQLWVVVEDKECLGVCLTEIVNYPRARALRIFAVGGKEREKWLHHIHMLKGWAKEIGCKNIEMFGRMGWQRVLKHQGWKTESMVMTLGLD